MPGSQPNSPAPTASSISEEQWQTQSPEHDELQILANTTDPQDSYDEGDDSSSIASLHSEYSYQSQGFHPVEDGGNEKTKW
ncbi:hypothetical protein GcC1_045032 [Golovinomyces cichoracearum]|uniref:Uncharacterized protein n=1 Tax=Golovinomyces cichoracearum TaxID=62708 RepID=A0A420IYE5_9PEZI|nr:hypothetical protein GcC1_045032 [Golovinomyces cichoracearum]